MDGNRARINGKWVEATKSYRHCHLYVDEKNNAYLWGRGDDFEDSLYGEADDDWWDYLEQDDLNDQPRIETFDPEELKFPTPEKKDDGITEEDIENHSCCD
ncbi:MAG: hypothetical protein GY839_10790 [candidate division Zixibacteria bacterium]|nr:hypothetical protein [candidate division Zixibacteria bacterium]